MLVVVYDKLYPLYRKVYLAFGLSHTKIRPAVDLGCMRCRSS